MNVGFENKTMIQNIPLRYRVNWIYLALWALIFVVGILLGVQRVILEGATSKDIGLLLFGVIMVYACVAFCWSKIVLGDKEFTTTNTLFRKTYTTLYSEIRNVYINDWFGIKIYSINYNTNKREGNIRVNAYFNWKDMLRQIYSNVSDI